jgi:general L-amino acid transport system substrate-binding protein
VNNSIAGPATRMGEPMRTTTRRALVPLVALALLGAACTSDDGDSGDATTPDDTESTDSTEETTEPEETTAPEETAAPDDTVEVVQGSESTLDAVIANDVVRCGTRPELPGFAVLTPEGDHVGFDSDFCRVVAAAVLGDAEKVEMVDLETADRFTALQSGEVDVLIRNTTWTASRDGGEGATFLTTTFYDGQGIMVGADSGFDSIEDLDGVIVCVAQGTTTEGNAANEASRLGLSWEVRAFESPELIQEAFIAGQCDAWSSDRSQLTALRSEFPDGPDALTILPEVFSKEPLGPAVADGDTQWAQAVNWRSWPRSRRRSSGSTRPTSTRSRPPRTSRSSGSSASRSPVTTDPPCSTRVSVCRPTSHCKWSLRSATTARSSTSTSHRSDWSGASTRCGPTAACSTRRRTADQRLEHPGPAVAGRPGAQVGVATDRRRHRRRGVVVWLYGNYIDNTAQQNIPTDFRFLDNPANFQITGNELSANAPVRDALYQGVLNTLRISVAGIVAATMLGTLMGIARLSSNWIVSKLATVYVEAVRNMPLALFVVAGLLVVVLGVFPTIQDAWNRRRPGDRLEPGRRRAVVRRRRILGLLVLGAVGLVVSVVRRQVAVDRCPTARVRSREPGCGVAAPS